jgi:uncharacterized membrane protein YgcG
MSPTRDNPNWIPIASLVLAVVVALLVYFQGGDPMDHLKVIAGYTILILVFFFGLMVLIAIARGTIDLKFLVSDNDTGHASMARFQLLIFTFIIGLSLFLIIIGNNKPKLEFPAIPNQVLTLLGISATTYAVGKHIQTYKGGDDDGGGGDGGGDGAGGQGGGQGAADKGDTKKT